MLTFSIGWEFFFQTHLTFKCQNSFSVNMQFVSISSHPPLSSKASFFILFLQCEQSAAIGCPLKGFRDHPWSPQGLKLLSN